jgi:hypothetical protein
LKSGSSSPNRVAAPRIAYPAIRVVRMSDDGLTEGLQRNRIDGVDVPIFNPVRTVVDCFKFRNKAGRDVATARLPTSCGAGALLKCHAAVPA